MPDRLLAHAKAFLRTGLIAGLVALAFVAPSRAAPDKGDERDVFSPLVASVIDEPNPVLGADGRVHLAYELMLINQSEATVTLVSIEALEADSKKPAESLEGVELAGVSRRNGGGAGNLIGPGGSATVFMDVDFAKGSTLPKSLAHRFAITLLLPAVAPVGGEDGAATAAAPVSLTFVGAEVPVGQEPAVVLAPPLKGPGWVIGEGCCASITSHRGATLAINGTIHVAERFAIDFVQLDAEGKLYAGAADQLSSYRYYGSQVYSVADGKVVATKDDVPEQVPGKLPEGATIENAGGNHVVVDIGAGRFALYAHLQPGSLKVKPGDTVKTGQPIGLLGNSGNTDAPHLHFHVMDGPGPLHANGLPYVFTAFSSAGVITDGDDLMRPEPAPIDETALAGEHREELPLNLQVVTFPEDAPATTAEKK